MALPKFLGIDIYFIYEENEVIKKTQGLKKKPKIRKHA